MNPLRTLADRIAVARSVLNGIRGRARGGGQGRLIIVDPGLVGQHGHHAMHCRYIVDSAHLQQIEVQLFAHADVSPAVQRDLGAIPHFRAYTYTANDPDPICGWLKTHMAIGEATYADLSRIRDLRFEDVVFFQGAQPAQVMAGIEWLTRLPEAQAPMVVIELGTDPGLKRRDHGKQGFRIPNPLLDGRATLYRYAVQSVRRVGSRSLHIVTYDRTVSRAYARLLDLPVGIVPFPIPAIAAPRARMTGDAVTVATLGHQQIIKGYAIMPEVAAQLLQEEPKVRLLIHNSDPEQKFSGGAEILKMAQRKLREMADVEPRLILDDRDVDAQEWNALLDSVDALLCPYMPEPYAFKHSGLMATSIAHGIPSIVPARTTLAESIKEAGRCGVEFQEFTAESVVAATRYLLKNKQRFALAAQHAAEGWRVRQGPASLLSSLKALNENRWGVGSPARFENAMPERSILLEISEPTAR